MRHFRTISHFNVVLHCNGFTFRQTSIYTDLYSERWRGEAATVTVVGLYENSLEVRLLSAACVVSVHHVVCIFTSNGHQLHVLVTTEVTTTC